MLLLLFATHADPVPSPLDMQSTALYIFLYELTVKRKLFQEISGGKSIDGICEWSPYINDAASPCAILCFDCDDSGLVSRMCAEDIEIGALQMEFGPPTIEVLMLIRCRQYGFLNTRLFPRASREIDISGNTYHGTPDLGSLPRKLQTFTAADNQFWGDVMLVDLPPTLRTLNLLRNSMKTALVCYDNLPESLQHVQIDHSEETKVKPMRAQAKPVDKTMFHQFNPKQIE